MSQLSHAQFPLRRHPRLLVDHRRAGSASVADSRGADAERLTGSGGRLHFGMVAGFKSERWPDCVGIRITAQGASSDNADIAHLSPLIWRHINFLGRYDFALPETVANGGLRPLRNPTSEGDF